MEDACTPPAHKRRRGPASFIIAIIVAGALIVGLRVLFGSTDAGGSEGSGTGRTACGGDGVTLNVVASSEKAAVLRTIADAYNGRETAGRCAEVVVTTKAS